MPLHAVVNVVRNLMRLHLTLILTILWTTTFGQDNYLKIHKISEGQEFYFPIIYSTDKLVEEKINVHLQLSELDLIKGKEKKSIFEVTSFNNGTIYGGKVSIDYNILANTAKLFSIKFNQSSCGATCAYWVRYHNFNPQNGDKYGLKDFFNHKNYNDFKKIVTPIRQEKIKKQIEDLIQSGDKLEHLEEYLYNYIDDDDLDDFYFTSDSIYFDNENLLNKNDKFWDLDHVTSISIESIRHLLNDLGESALITGNNLKTYRSSTEPQLYEGTLDNKSNFYLLFKNDYENNYIGTFAYKKYGRAIGLDGKLEDDEFIFNARNNKNDKMATITFRQNGSNLKGIWKDKKGKNLMLKASRK
jgi:hypothetical protein